MIGVAISTTGDDFRMGFLETCINAWRQHLPLGSVLIVTVDGDEIATERAYQTCDPKRFGNVYQVGQVAVPYIGYIPDTLRYREGRLGVAVNKNTGLELLMKQGVEDIFLCDDDTWPLSTGSLIHHTRLGRDHGIMHNMICWGAGRKPKQYTNYASWSWPRGVLLYAHSTVVDRVGGMDERFGPGGHEHVEWSNRIHNAGFTPKPFCSPRAYASSGGMGVEQFWRCSDIERTHKSSVRRVGADWKHIKQIMAEREGDTSFVPYTADQNGRESATLWTSLSAKEPGRT
jgi:hypothetical protein